MTVSKSHPKGAIQQLTGIKPIPRYGWSIFPDERPPKVGYYRVETGRGAKAAGFWNGLSWEYDIINAGMRAPLRQEHVQYFRSWEDE